MASYIVRVALKADTKRADDQFPPQEGGVGGT